MNFAGGVLHWTHDAFWSCPLPYFRAAFEGWALANGVKQKRVPEMKAERLKQLFAKADAFDAAVKKREAGHGA